MARRWTFYMDILPIVAVIGNQLILISLLTLFKAATLQGMDNYVFLSYASGVAATLLFPITFFSRRSRALPPLSFSIVSKIILNGLMGSSSQILYYAGISYSSPTLASSITNLLPAFTFILAIVFRMEKIDAKSRRSTYCKVMGSITSIAGAFVLTLYKGPLIIKAHSHIFLPLQQPISFLKSGDANWVIASILLTAECLIVSVSYILQVDVLKVFPDEVTVILFFNVTITAISTLVAFFAVPNADAWKIRSNLSLISILCTGVVQKVMGYIIGTWALRLKGPVYVTSFAPLQIVISVAMGVIFLGDALPIGSIIGATIISIGFYAVLWGKSKEEIEEDVLGNLEPPPTTAENVPLLPSHGTSSGISYSSPTLASSIANLVPAFTFILAVICRMEKLAVKSRSSQAKVMGSIISIAGAFVLSFYKGPSIINAHSHISLLLQQPINFLKSEDASWTIGGILLIGDYVLTSVWYILLVDILKVFPDELTLVFFYNVTATVLCTTIGFFAVPNVSAWKIRLDISLISILGSGIFGKLMSNVVCAWAVHLKGPVYVTSFKPLQIVIAAAMGVMFLDDTLYIGSVVGATIVSIGLYAVLWGKAKEEIEDDVGSLESSTTENLPLLQSQRTKTSEKNVK